MSKKRIKYNESVFYTFDIETTTLITGHRGSHIELNAIVYSGQFYDGSIYTQVRSIEKCIEQIKRINECYDPEEGAILIFVHFLSYEFQFLKDFFDFTDIIATQKRKIIRARWSNVEFRCSFFLSNMNLAKFLESEQVPVEYQKKKMDFSIRRYPWTELDPEDQLYMRNDVVGLHKAICNYRDNTCTQKRLKQLPLTSTGVVRRDFRNAFNSNKLNRYRYFLKNRMNVHLVHLNQKAFRGGDVHANRYNAFKLMSNVLMLDIASSYPYELMVNKFPTKWNPMLSWTQKEFDFLMRNEDDYATLMVIYVKGVTIKKGITVPSISLSKVEKAFGFTTDNGRILTLETGRMYMTEVDYKLMHQQYEVKEEKFEEIYYSKKEPLPLEMKNVIMDYFRAKCELKHKDPYYYAKAKNKLNSCYGMFVTKIIRDEYTFMDHNVEIDYSKNEYDKLDAFYNSFSNFLSYQQGIYVTAYARRSLHEMISKIDPKDYVYNDTDSTKFVYRQKYLPIIDEINTKRMRKALKHHAYCVVGGKTYTMGQWENEGVVPKFITFGSKKYIYKYSYQDRQAAKHDLKTKKKVKKGFEITIAGVPKELGHDYIIEQIKKGKIDSPFDIGDNFVFRNVKTTMIFNDIEEPYYFKISEGKEVLIHSNIASYDGSYTMGTDADYKYLLDFTRKYDKIE